MAHLDLEGSTTKQLDDKDRVGISPRHSRVLTQEVVLSPSPSPCIDLRDLHTWEAYKKRLQEKAAKGSRKHRQLVRHIIGDSRHVKIDGQNRVRVNPDLAEWASIPTSGSGECREVKIIGVGDRLELWGAQVYRNYRDELKEDFESTFDEMMMDDEPADAAE